MQEQPDPQRIGAILRRTTSLTEEALANCLSLQPGGKPRRRLGQILVEETHVTDGNVAAALAQQFGYTFLDCVPKDGPDTG